MRVLPHFLLLCRVAMPCALALVGALPGKANGAGLTQSLGESAANFTQISARGMERHEAATARVSAPGARDGLWVESASEQTHVGDKGAQDNGYRERSAALTMGLKLRLDSFWSGGAAVTVSDTRSKFDAHDANGRSDSATLSVYGVVQLPGAGLQMTGIVSISQWNNTLSRQIDLGTVAGSTRGAFRVNGGSIYLEASKAPSVTSLGNAVLPYVGASVSHHTQAGYTETTRGGTESADLDYDRTGKTSVSSVLGLRSRYAWDLAGRPLIVEGDLSWRHRFSAQIDEVATQLANAPSNRVEIMSSPLARNQVGASLGLRWSVDPGFKTYLILHQGLTAKDRSTGLTIGLNKEL